jgi:hypothetical protein
MDDFRGGVGVLPETTLERFTGEIAGQNASHAIVTKAFTGLVPDNEFDLAWPAFYGGFCR